MAGEIALRCPWSLLMISQNWFIADDIFRCIFLNENVWISLMISLKFVSRGPINNILGLVQIMAWRQSGAEPLPEPMMGLMA